VATQTNRNEETKKEEGRFVIYEALVTGMFIEGEMIEHVQSESGSR
jgi:hypothetical protein